ncbi:diguanylate cyclase (GGDEF)-like protein [Bacillus mesophilus]|uniref:Diguanylate cyclase n=1 Tax=Bacillus mesophilus TaxID=1808955 RepID=A0A6M0QE12_9BACI|nr:GGDEF domain-containing protein [Bacillus mesophilus]MBM7662838.1 diguanylate cyclase (GGDEF)-like protein [Bacillus mesophilus]NEY73428.1 diguanylate cyclase [Bacillus mesophilus]
MEKKDVTVLQQQVTLLRAEGKYKEAIGASYELIKLGNEMNSHKSLLVAYLNLAASYYCIGDIEEAFNNIEAYSEICRDRGDETDHLQLFNVLFLLYDYNKDYDRAKQTLAKSIELGEKLAKYNIISNGYSNLSHVLMLEEKFEEALHAAEQGLKIAKLHTPASPILEIRVSLNIALAYIGLGELEVADTLIKEIENQSVLDSFIREKSQSYILRGKWHVKQKNWKEAMESFNSAKELVVTYQDLYLLKTIQEERCKICDEMGDIQLGYLIQKEYISLLNEINQRELSLKAIKLEVKHHISEMERKANLDFLSGISNRSYLETTANDWLKKAHKENENVVCIAFDVDDFKTINDKYGHLCGDEVIKQVGKVCKETFSENDLIGRYGGDEFVILLYGETIEQSLLKVEKLKIALRKLHIESKSESLAIKTSIGVADNQKGQVKEFKDLFLLADQSLYLAKQNGKDQVLLYTAMHE